MIKHAEKLLASYFTKKYEIVGFVRNDNEVNLTELICRDLTVSSVTKLIVVVAHS
jgi:hypothetical protein